MNRKNLEDNTIISNNKRIAKNTLFLYIRMFLVMGVSLFTVRIVLNALGVIDYGIYNAVGGMTVLFTFLSGTMAHASQRFFSYELGKGDKHKIKEIFKANMTIYAIISVVVVLLTETIGLWFVNVKMVIPPERLGAANWIYQFSILSFVFSMFSAPCQAVIISREKMSMFAYISIFEVFAKLSVAYLMLVVACDKLKFYAVLHFFVVGGIALIYILLCKKRYEECSFTFNWNREYLGLILGYTGWSFYGHAAMSLRGQGVNILLNLFFGPAVNTARGIAFQVNTAVYRFCVDFFMAVKPQIIKYYAQNNFKEMYNLIYRSSKFCYFLTLLVSIPVLLEMHFILQLWLKNIPEYTILFSRIVIITSLVDAISLSLSTSADATGKIKHYQLLIGTIILLNIPLCWIFFKLGCLPQAAMYTVLCVAIVVLIFKIFMAKKMVCLPVKDFFVKVIATIMMVTVTSFIFPVLLLNYIDEGLARLCIITCVSIGWTGAMIYLLGLSKNERRYVASMIKIQKEYL